MKTIRLCYLILIAVAKRFGSTDAYALRSTVLVEPGQRSAWHDDDDDNTRLFTTPLPPSSQRQPRRNLQKRPRRVRKQGYGGGSYYPTSNPEDFPWDTAESRSLISSAAKEAGEDYWIDLEELQREKERVEQIKARDPGQIPDQKLWTEILSPYKQNWIGLISVTIIAISFIFKNFPEVINPPIIANIPDL